MNKILSYCMTICLLIVLQNSSLEGRDPRSMMDMLDDPAVEQQVLGMTDIFELKYSEEIKRLILDYTTNGRRSSEVILNRANYYFPIFERIIAEQNLPQELKYLSVIESALRPTVKSKAGAVGLWQFMSSTARMYDLQVVGSNDERKDVAKSTQAALLYLTDLYNRYDDWALALAAYNCGPGNVNKAIRRAGGVKNYWKIRRFLPRETRRYLPKMIATMYVMQYSQDLGLEKTGRDFSEHKSFGIAYINDKTSFKKIAELSGISVKEIAKHNPSYAYGYIPSSIKGNSLILPEAYLLKYLHNTQQMENLSLVFYLKDALSIKEEEMELPAETIIAESTRIVSIDPLLQLDLMEQFVVTDPLKSDLTIKPNTLVWQPQLNVVRLGKRQSLKDMKALKHLRPEDIKSISTSGILIHR